MAGGCAQRPQPREWALVHEVVERGQAHLFSSSAIIILSYGMFRGNDEQRDTVCLLSEGCPTRHLQ